MAEMIGRYEIVYEMGRGGMATVFLAFDPQINRQVAVKTLPRQFTHDPRFIERFYTEVKTIAGLEHRAIVPVYDSGEHKDAPYLVMRYMAGGSLRDRLGRGPLSLGETAYILDAIAPALDLAHTRGFIHRDLKPANVLFDEPGDPYLADFGIARMAEATHTMTLVGTPAYMSPEQAKGTMRLDGRSDIYALGAMLFEVLADQTPYEAETLTGQMLRHILDPIPDILAANPALPQKAQAIIDKAMAKDREDRYATAGELAAELNALAAGNEAIDQLWEFDPDVAAAISIGTAEANAPADPLLIFILDEDDEKTLVKDSYGEIVVGTPLDLTEEERQEFESEPATSDIVSDSEDIPPENNKTT